MDPDPKLQVSTNKAILSFRLLGVILLTEKIGESILVT